MNNAIEQIHQLNRRVAQLERDIKKKDHQITHLLNKLKKVDKKSQHALDTAMNTSTVLNNIRR